MKSTVLQMFDHKMMYLNLQLLWTGMSISYWSAVLIPTVILQQDTGSENEKTSKALYAMISFGFGESIAA
jgi:hypothetical protein